MKKHLVNIIFLIFVSLFYIGCGATSINYDEYKREIVLLNNGEKTIIPNIDKKFDTEDRRVIDTTKGSSRVTRFKGHDDNCRDLVLYEYLPLGSNRFYITHVFHDLEKTYNNKPDKENNFYTSGNKYKFVIGIETGGGHGPNSKTFLEMNPECWNKYKNNTNNSKIDLDNYNQSGFNAYGININTRTYYDENDLNIDGISKKDIEEKFGLYIKEYLEFKENKAMAIAIDKNGKWSYGRSYGFPLESSAKKRALKECSSKNSTNVPCRLYMVGNQMVTIATYE